MSLKHALLGFLYYESMTGYQLKQYFDNTVRHFWPASLSQIYPTLNQMNEEGLLDVEIIYQDKPLNSKVYHITAKGKEEFIKWISAPMNTPNLRNAFLIKIFMGALVGKDVIIAQLKQQIELSRKRLKISLNGKKHLEDDHFSKGDRVTEAVYWMATVDYGLKFDEFTIAWCEDTIKKLDNM